jgi:signal transduction histidine kinase
VRAGAVRSHRAIASDAAAGPAQTRMAWLLMDSVMTVLVLASTARYVINHGMNDLATLVLCGATALLAGYLARRALNPGLHPVWLAAVCLLWLVLVAIAPSFGWCVVVLAFAALRILAFRHAVVVVGVLIVGLIAATLRISDHFDPTVVAGPICLAVLAVATYRALDNEAERRQRLLDDLLRTQDDLAAAERTAGALSERQRLSREIHDSVTQDLASVSLLLEAATAQWQLDPARSHGYVRQAAVSARQGLVEARGLVGALARPAVLDGSDLPQALARLASTTLLSSGAAPAVFVEGTPRPVSDEVAAAAVRTARGALANVAEHASATRAVLTLTYLPDAISLDVRDDGRGFAHQASAHAARGAGGDGRGFGLSGIRSRVAALGGTVVVESAPGDGTALAVLLPTASDRSR